MAQFLVKTVCVNLDCDFTEAADLWKFWNRYRFARKADRFQLFGHTGKTTARACKDLANYAANKATAMQCRARGEIHTALQYEDICERIYQGLPDYARW